MINDLFPEAVKYCDTLAGYKPEGGYLYWVLGGLAVVLWWLLLRPRRQLAKARRLLVEQKSYAKDLNDLVIAAQKRRDEMDYQRADAVKKLQALQAAHAQDEELPPGGDETTFHDVLAVSTHAHAAALETVRQTCVAVIKSVEVAASDATGKLGESASGVRQLTLKTLELFAAVQKDHVASVQALTETALTTIRELMNVDDIGHINKALEALGMQQQQQGHNPLKLVHPAAAAAQPSGEEHVEDDDSHPA